MKQSLDVKRQYRRNVLQKFCTHFRVPKQLKDEIFTDEVLDEEIVYSDVLEDKYDLKTVFYAAHIVGKLNLDTFLNPKKFLTGPVYKAYLEGDALHSCAASPFVMAVHLKTVIWLVYQMDEEYEGEGAIVLNTEEGQFIIEPIQNWLNYNHPYTPYEE